jgi:DNA repair exonuclease SbcCD nuclease subunit
MMFKFIHSADWQLGKPFGGMENDLAGELKAARRNIISNVARIATSEQAQHVVVAGDVWDSELPSPGEIRKPMDLMSDAEEITWWLMPGNHDLHRTGSLWARVERQLPKNVKLLLEPSPVEAEPGVFFLPAPWTTKFPATDLTAWMDDAQTPNGAIRIGIGHGGYKAFGSDAAEKTVIDEGRPGKARLDYLALGDWHGKLQVNDKTWYSGTPEPDRFVNNDRGFVLSVEIAAAGSEPKVKAIKSASFDWPVLEFELRTSDDVHGLRKNILDNDRKGSSTLAQVVLSGSLSLSDRALLDRELDALRAQLSLLDVRQDELQTVIQPNDLDALDVQGSVRQAAERLQLMLEHGGERGEDAELALSFLFTFSEQQAQVSS